MKQRCPSTRRRGAICQNTAVFIIIIIVITSGSTLNNLIPRLIFFNFLFMYLTSSLRHNLTLVSDRAVLTDTESERNVQKSVYGNLFS